MPDFDTHAEARDSATPVSYTAGSPIRQWFRWCILVAAITSGLVLLSAIVGIFQEASDRLS